MRGPDSGKLPISRRQALVAAGSAAAVGAVLVGTDVLSDGSDESPYPHVFEPASGLESGFGTGAYGEGPFGGD